jgi:hypothetical protein
MGQRIQTGIDSCRQALKAMMLVALGLCLSPAFAQTEAPHNELSLVLGEADPDIGIGGVAYTRTFDEWSMLSCDPLAEGSLEGWRASGDSPQRHTLTTIGALGGCRWSLFGTSWLSGELGLGARLLSRTELTGRGYSTAFQFQEFIGLHARVDSADRFFVALRLRHVSNGDIKRPNPGFTGPILLLGTNF